MKPILSLIAIALLFAGSNQSRADDIEACVNKNNGNTRILFPYSNSEDCRISENFLSLGSNGDGDDNCDCNKVIIHSDPIEGDCFVEADTAIVVCPAGMTPLYGKCDVDILMGNPSYIATPLVTNYTTTTNFPTNQIAHSVICNPNCFEQGSGPGENIISTTAIAVCIDDPLQVE